MSGHEDHPRLEMSPGLKQAVSELMETGMDEMTAARHLMATRPEVFTGSPGDEVAKLLASWD